MRVSIVVSVGELYATVKNSQGILRPRARVKAGSKVILLTAPYYICNTFHLLSNEY